MMSLMNVIVPTSFPYITGLIAKHQHCITYSYDYKNERERIHTLVLTALNPPPPVGRNTWLLIFVITTEQQPESNHLRESQ
jgi:hypothetical protein